MDFRPQGWSPGPIFRLWRDGVCRSLARLNFLNGARLPVRQDFLSGTRVNNSSEASRISGGNSRYGISGNLAGIKNSLGNFLFIQDKEKSFLNYSIVVKSRLTR